ncbi:riboflavin synthase [Terrimonas pollutisoli]|uniref:riboflavin synthase n=1 Tax=Terrimonas pollutisoli TaxID=3034147 RepID=UPI0023EB000B|nr:riboflavin synthase [Terrimonas sp. H1YJ31]
MFTGIVESTAIVRDVISDGSNKTFWLESTLAGELKIDQSVSHSGVCLTVEEVNAPLYRVTAIDETLQKTNLGIWQPGALVNLERCLAMNGRLDGHFVQGHVDTVGTCVNRIEKEGSWEFEIEFSEKFAELIIEKGSICANGISLTVFNVTNTRFTVGIIPYTFNHTNIQTIQSGDIVNLEFDLLGKYLVRRLSLEK